MLWVTFVLSALIAYAATELSIVLSMRRGILDIPNPRSSHSGVVPRMGGIGILCGFYLPLGGIWLAGDLDLIQHTLSLRQLGLVAIAGGGMAAIGLLDDLRRLSPAVKYLLQFVLALVTLGFGIRLENFPVPPWGAVVLGFFSIPVTLLWLTGFSNIYNFMDGINGLAAGTGVLYSGFFSLLAWRLGMPELGIVALLLAGSCLGFLFHNFPHARTFMGDTGSLFLGMMFALFVVWTPQLSRRPAALTASLLVCSVFLFDSGFTLLRRIWHREKIFEAHRSHLYQRLVQAGLSHAKVTCLYLLLHALMGSLALAYLDVPGAARAGILGFASFDFVIFAVTVYWLERKVSNSKLEGRRVLG